MHTLLESLLFWVWETARLLPWLIFDPTYKKNPDSYVRRAPEKKWNCSLLSCSLCSDEIMLNGSESKYLRLISDPTFTPFHAAFYPTARNPGHVSKIEAKCCPVH